MDSDFDIAVSRVSAWLRDYGTTKSPQFFGDLSIILLAAKERVKAVNERDEARALARTLAVRGDATMAEYEAHPWLEE